MHFETSGRVRIWEIGEIREEGGAGKGLEISIGSLFNQGKVPSFCSRSRVAYASGY